MYEHAENTAAAIRITEILKHGEELQGAYADYMDLAPGKKQKRMENTIRKVRTEGKEAKTKINDLRAKIRSKKEEAKTKISKLQTKLQSRKEKARSKIHELQSQVAE